jgi:hexosaminidase
MYNIFFAIILFLISAVAQAQNLPINIIPQPVSVQRGNGNFTISKKTVIAVRDEEDKKAAHFFNSYLKQFYGFELDIDKQESKNYIRINTRKFIQAPGKDAYQMEINNDGVSIDGDTYAGSFYGIQSLIQLLPLPAERTQLIQQNLIVPHVTIRDEPRFNYRGMHLDVGRHFFNVAFIKKYIDYLALHKMNFFHWHLTEDQGWRIEIKKYPALIQTAAFRDGTIIGRYPGIANDNTRYGGYYTHEEIREVVQYATSRHITVIPEIEMPGHSSAAIAAYPWLSCFPEKPTTIPTHPSKESKIKQANGVNKLVQETWGVFEDVYCAGKDSTFVFLEDVLDEVLELFPSKYIHIGGDESPKAHWKKCPQCQERIKKEGLKDEHHLQSYFVQRIEKYLNAKGRILIGWDEILEGGLAPNAVVMSWRGEKGGIEAAKQDHQVIMTPQKPVYFDHTQTRTEDSVVIGGYNNLESVYNYEPVPKELPEEKEKFVLGAQANVWTEYMRYPSKVEYMVFPRMSALSEVLWTSRDNRNWNAFEQKLMMQFKRFDLWKVHYSKAYFDLKVSIQPTKNFNGVSITAEPRDNSGMIQLVKKGQSAEKFSSPFLIKNTSDFEIHYVREQQVVNKVPLAFSFNKATGKKISITKTPNSMYPGQAGAFSLVNGIVAPRGLGYPDWMGWIGDDVEALIDLGKKNSFSTVKLHTIDQNGSWIYLPKSVEVYSSNDGKKFTLVGRTSDFVKSEGTLGWMTVKFPIKSARYIKVIAKNNGIIAEGKPGGGSKAWIFASEIQVN